MEELSEIQRILDSGTVKEKREFFAVNRSTPFDVVLFKLDLWGRHFLPNYHKSEDAPFHEAMNRNKLEIYMGRTPDMLESQIVQYIEAAFRGAGKDVKTKEFIAFMILNDTDHVRRYFKVLSEDGDNSVQSVTDIYNILVRPRILRIYPETFASSALKKQKRMDDFSTTHSEIRVTADVVGTGQRGDNEDEKRPDFIWYNDFETRDTLKSARKTQKIWDNMEEARTGLEKGGVCLYTCNYTSEQGNVHKLISEKQGPHKKTLIVPISENQSITPIIPTWDRYSVAEIEAMIASDDDFWGERMCKPDASKDIYFDREVIDRMDGLAKAAKRDIAGFRMYADYDPSHAYAGGHDVAGGVGLDSSTSVFLDFSTVPAQDVGVFHSNTIGPEAFGDEIYSEANRFGGCLVAPENNKYDQAVLKARLLGARVYRMPANPLRITPAGTKPPTEWGWHTNGLTKSRMLDDLRDAIKDGLLMINDPDLRKELRNYTRNDLIERENDPRNTTRHFDLVMACAIAWQMKDHARAKTKASVVGGQTGPGWTKKVNPAK